jgi:hypothetical protein
MTDRHVCTVEVSPDEVDAGADITLKIRVESPRTDELRGSRVSIRNHEGTELALAELEPSDDDAYESNDIVLAAPGVVGEYLYRAIIVAPDKDGTLHERTSAEVRFAVRPHTAELNVWDVPSAIVAGERFKFTVGVRCSAGCNLAGRGLTIVDGNGSQVGAAHLGHNIVPGTDAIYCADVEAEAPATAGGHRWEIKTAAWDSELPHKAASATMAVRVVRPPDCEVTVETVDRENQCPIKGATVVMHPYRATTDEKGVAKIKVTKGRYDILVSGSKYVPVRILAEVTADMATRAELEMDSPWESPDEA